MNYYLVILLVLRNMKTKENSGTQIAVMINCDYEQLYSRELVVLT